MTDITLLRRAARAFPPRLFERKARRHYQINWLRCVEILGPRWLGVPVQQK